MLSFRITRICSSIRSQQRRLGRCCDIMNLNLLVSRFFRKLVMRSNSLPSSRIACSLWMTMFKLPTELLATVDSVWSIETFSWSRIIPSCLICRFQFCLPRFDSEGNSWNICELILNQFASCISCDGDWRVWKFRALLGSCFLLFFGMM